MNRWLSTHTNQSNLHGRNGLHVSGCSHGHCVQLTKWCSCCHAATHLVNIRLHRMERQAYVQVDGDSFIFIHQANFSSFLIIITSKNMDKIDQHLLCAHELSRYYVEARSDTGVFISRGHACCSVHCTGSHCSVNSVLLSRSQAIWQTVTFSCLRARSYHNCL